MSKAPVSYKDDQQLIEEIVNKDKKAFSKLYDKYAKALYSLIYSTTGNLVVSEEILQSVFCSVWHLAHEFRPSQQRVFTWMLRIAGGMTKTHLNSVKEEIPEQDNYVNDPKELIHLEDSKGVLDLVLTKGQSLLEAAERAGCGTEEIRTRLHLECKAFRGL